MKGWAGCNEAIKLQNCRRVTDDGTSLGRAVGGKYYTLYSKYFSNSIYLLNIIINLLSSYLVKVI